MSIEANRIAGNVLAIPREYSSHAELEAMAHRYKQLRLAALKLDPEAFSSTYERESQFPDETWFARVRNPEARTFIALSGHRSAQNHADDSVKHLLNQPWVGQLTIFGPKLVPLTSTSENRPWEIFLDSDKKSLSIPPNGTNDDDGLKSDPHAPAAVTTYHALYILLAMFVHPDGRRKGNGLRLINAAVAAAREDATVRIRADRATVVVFAEVPNVAARRLYETAGFTVRVEEVVLKSRDGEAPVVVLTMDVDVDVDVDVDGIAIPGRRG